MQPVQPKSLEFLLLKLQEESAEVIQAVSKIRRFGPHSHHPDRQETNLQELLGELEDWLATLAAIEGTQFLTLEHSRENILRKCQALL